MCAPDDPRIVGTMTAIRERLWVKTEVGGIARYEHDQYHQVSSDVAAIPGNPWFVCTLWVAEWFAETARTPEDLERAAELLAWACCSRSAERGARRAGPPVHRGAALGLAPHLEPRLLCQRRPRLPASAGSTGRGSLKHRSRAREEV